MPSSQASLELTDDYQRDLVQQRRRAAEALTASWPLVDGDNLETSYGAWAVASGALISETQRTGITASRLYLAAFIASELARRSAPLAVGDIGRFAGQDRFGRTLDRALTPPLMTIKAAIASGEVMTRALRMGQNRAMRIAADAMAAAPRAALLEQLRGAREVIGWRRVATGSKTCGACLADATGDVRDLKEPFRIHTSCDCVSEPVVDGARDHVQRPTGRELFDAMTVAQQNEMFAGHGGEAKAELVRSGAIDFQDLISADPRVIGQDGITETPLAELVA